MGYEQHQLGSDTKNDVKLKVWIKLKQEREEQGTHGRAHDRAAGTERDSVRVNEREEKKREWIVLTLDLDTDFTTKSMIRALKLV